MNAPNLRPDFARTHPSHPQRVNGSRAPILPYVGITGFTSLDDVSIIPTLPRPAFNHRLMAGVLVSAKTLRGEAVGSKRYPAIGEVRGLLLALKEAGAWPTVHFNTRDLAHDLERLMFALGGTTGADGDADNPVTPFASQGALGGIQFNVVCPPCGELEWLRTVFPHVEIILQVNGSSLREFERATKRSRHPVEAVGAYVAQYADDGLCDHVLLDLSGGRGEFIDAAWCASVLDHYALPWFAQGLSVGIAGGLGPNADVKLREIAGYVSRGTLMERLISYDAESAVRVPVHPEYAIEGEKHQDALDGEKARAYVEAVNKGMGWTD